jgi:UPF0755 protein
VKILRRFFYACLVLGVLFSAAALWWLNQPLRLAGETVELSIEPGTPTREVAAAWVRAGVKAPSSLLYYWFRGSGQAKKIRAGSYAIAIGTTPRELLEKMVRGDEIMASVRLIEGWSLRQFRAELARSPYLKQTTAALSDMQLMAAIGSPESTAEGYFYPDTYAFSKGATDLVVLKRAHASMQRQLQLAWAVRDPHSPLRTTQEALILASIVEKETGAAADRGKVAGVFINRLRLDMPLQTDPTVIYGLGTRFDGKIYKRDLQADTPYNTYTRKGLPPTPIAMPGKAALLAAVHPESTKALYFVAKGNGESQFSESLAEHNRAVQKYQR